MIALTLQPPETPVTRTRFLLALLVLVISIRLYPDRVNTFEWVAIVGGALYCVVWGASRFLAKCKARNAQAAQAAADEQEYRQYKGQLESIRAQFDPNRNLDDPASIAPEYKNALSALHDEHEAMLTRKFGAS